MGSTSDNSGSIPPTASLQPEPSDTKRDDSESAWIHMPKPERIGPYKLLQVLGEGGFGVVYLAEQTEPLRRRVALKIIKPGMDTKTVIARFEAERQALAMMDHPNVARVFDAGVTDPSLGSRPYFVMELVHGEPITTYCDRHRLTIKQRLELFIPVCEAVQHAHMKGIIHRDLKPSNVLVMVQDDKAVPKVIDFGVAKAINQQLTEKTIFTEQGQLIGTPEYMSPEQAEMNALDIDTRSDVYSLGVLLYELLTGVLPFDAEMLRSKGFAEIQRIIREVDPPRPSTRLSSLSTHSIERADGAAHANDRLSAQNIARHRQSPLADIANQLRDELEWIPLKAMRKDRNERYYTPKDFVDDIINYLQGKPLAAGPETASYLLRKWLRRNQTPVVVVTAFVFIAVLLMSGFIISSIMAMTNLARADQHLKERDSALKTSIEQTRIALEQQSIAAQRAAESRWQSFEAKLVAAELLIASGPASSFDPYAEYDRLQERAWKLVHELPSLQPNRTINVVKDGVTTEVTLPESPFQELTDQRVTSFLAYSSDGAFALTCVIKKLTPDDSSPNLPSIASNPNLPLRYYSAGTPQVISVADNHVICSLEGGRDTIDGVAGGSRVKFAGQMTDVQFSPNGARVVIAYSTGNSRVWDSSNGKLLLVCMGHTCAVSSIVFSPDSERFATVAEDSTARIWSITDGRVLSELRHGEAKSLCIEFSNDSQYVVVGSSDGTACVYDARTASLLTTLRSDAEEVVAAFFSPDDKRIVTAGSDGLLSIWRIENSELISTRRVWRH